MIGKILILAAVAVATWLLTRPRKKRKTPIDRTHKKLVRCPSCGVFNEAGVDCQCQKKA